MDVSRFKVMLDAAIHSHELTYHSDRKGFIPPTVQEVTEYAESIGYELDGQNFVDFYTAKGWMIGRNKMKDWRAAVRTWKKRDVVPKDGFSSRLARAAKQLENEAED